MKKIFSVLAALLVAMTVSADTLPKMTLTSSGQISTSDWTEGCTVNYDGTDYADASLEYTSDSKKSIRIKLNKKKALIGDNKYKQWVLLSNSDDATNMRNALADEISTAVGMEYTPQYQFVSLYVNGTYAGIYQLTDRIKAEEGRAGTTGTYTDWLVQLSEEGDVSSSDTYVTGTDDMPYIVMKNPDPDDYANDKATLETYRKAMDTYFTAAFADPKSYLKQDQFVAWYLASEIICNYKGFSEVYAYRNTDASDNLLRFGPLWDNEKGFNNNSSHAIDMSDINTADSYEGLMIKYADHKLLRKWVKALLDKDKTSDNWFRDAVWTKWQTLSSLKQTLLNKITTLEESVGKSDAESDLKTYITDRFAYLDVKLAEITGNSTSGITTVINNFATNNNDIYSISGQRLSSEPTHGIYIKNGKKVIVK